MTKMLRIAADLELPLEAQTQTLVVYGGKGMGKSTFGRVFCEELAAAGLRFSYFDPLNVNWGLRHGATRSVPGLDLVILGGPHGDIPIEPGSGKVVADFVADEDVSTIVVPRAASGAMWGAGERIRFAADYFGHLFERQSETRRALMQLIDECGRFCPQNPARGDVDIARCVGAIEQLVEWGRNAATGVTLITQRSARMNKSISELAEMMIAFRTVGPNSVAAVMNWLGENVDKERHADIRTGLRKLEIGSALVVSPGWLDFEGVAHMRPSRTYDSSATPKPGQNLKPPGPARKPDLARYLERMAETKARAEADDPKVLRKKVAELEREIARKPAAAPAPKAERIEVPVLTDQDRFFLGDFVAHMTAVEEAGKALATVGDHVETASRQLGAAAKRLLEPARPALVGRPIPALEGPAKQTLRERAAAHRDHKPSNMSKRTNGAHAADGEVKLGKGDRVTMVAIAQYPDGVTPEQISVLTEYTRSSRNTFLQRLGAAGYIDKSGRTIVPTQAGLDWLGDDFEPLPTGEDLQRYWLEPRPDRLPEGQRRVLEVAIKAYPKPVPHERIDELTSYTRSSRNTFIQKLGARQLVVRGRGEITASEHLFS